MLHNTVNAAVTEGIRAIATVHDSFSCLPSRAARFRRLIRGEFARMYHEHDVLQEVFDAARADLDDPNNKRMPLESPAKGPLNIGDVLSA
jgi:DNA-directed RNA polymerase, mitochondrial